MIAERNIVVARISLDCTHKGEFMSTPPTGKKVTFHRIDMIRLRHGKAVEVWHRRDHMMVLAQLEVKVPM